MLNHLKTTLKNRQSATRGAMIIAFFSILGKVLALVRDRLLASRFGAGDLLDIYYASFKLPDLIFNTLVLGALSSAFVPIFVSLYRKSRSKSHDEDTVFSHWELSSAVMNNIFLITFVLSVIVFIFARPLVGLLTPGFSPEKIASTASLTRIMLFSIIFFGFSNVFSGILQSTKRFFIYSLAPLMYNMGIIAGILFFVSSWGPSGLAWGVVLGAFLHFVIQIPEVLRLGFRWLPILGWRESSLKQVIRLMLPRTLALGVNQLNLFFTTVIASLLSAGSIAIYNLAFNLESVPVSVFAISFAVASFPVLSELHEDENKVEFVEHLTKVTIRILFLLLPLSLFVIALRAQIVRLILGAGYFDWEDTILTADSLGYFSISLFAQGLIPLFSRAFYSIKNTRTPVCISLVSVIVNISLAFALSHYMGVVGLALAFSIASILNISLLFAFLHHKLGNIGERQIFSSIFRIAIASLGSIFALQVVKYAIAGFVDMQRFAGVLIQFTLAGLAGALTYLLIIFMIDDNNMIGLLRKNKKVGD